MLRRALISLVVLIGAVYLWLAFVGIEPVDRRPGTKLAGTVSALPTDWSELAEVQEVHLETRPWYGIPFSVTVVAAADPSGVYLPSIYDAPQPFPGSKYWNAVVQAHPDVRLRVKDKLYEMRIEPMLEPEGHELGLRALARKYPFWQEQQQVPAAERNFVILRLGPRSG